jgi:hypothetical protein
VKKCKKKKKDVARLKKELYIMFILKANHNKDYSVVKTFRAALLSKRRSLFLKNSQNLLTTAI